MTFRRATWDDREGLLAELRVAFASPERPHPEFGAMYPHLFTRERIGENLVCDVGGKIVGAVGLYRFDVRCGDVVFKGGGVGQVSSLPEFRGRKVMSTLLAAQIRAAADVDFLWLWGDAARYGRFGFVPGGAMYVIETFDRYLPKPDPACPVAEIGAAEALPAIHAPIARWPTAVIVRDGEIPERPGGSPRRFFRAETAIMVATADLGAVILADGTPAAIAQLLRHALEIRRAESPDRWRIEIRCDPANHGLLGALRPLAHSVRIQPSAMFRAVNLPSLFSKATRLAGIDADDLPERLRIAVAGDGRAVAAGNEHAPLAPNLELDPRALSDLFFGLYPPEVAAPGIAAGSVLRSILPLPCPISELFAL